MSSSVFFVNSPIVRIFAFFKQFDERTESSSSSTGVFNQLIILSSPSSLSSVPISSLSLKLINTAKCSFAILAASDKALSGVIVPSVQTSRTNLS